MSSLPIEPSPGRPDYLVAGPDLWQWRQAAQAAAIANDIDPYEVDWLLQEVAGVAVLTLRLGASATPTPLTLNCSLADLEQLWQRRLGDRQPVQYLAGRTPWRDFSLRVSPAVLIPRPETEEIIDLALATAPKAAHTGHWADLGTGSGAIALGLARTLPAASIHAVDCSAAALAIAQQNADANGLGDRVQFYLGSWFAPLQALRGQLSGMVSNPPYIPRSVLSTLQPEVVQHEPQLALDGGDDGLAALRHLVAIAPEYLRPGGLWLVEIMVGQAIAVSNLLTVNGHYSHIQSHYDLSGNERFISACLRSPG